jgi:putative DNA primase/helicase
LEEHRPALAVIDPVTYLIDGKTDMYRSNEIGQWIGNLRSLAKKHDTAILIVRHTTKSGGSTHLQRGNGSIAFHARARSALLAGKESGRFVLVHSKSNYAKPSASLQWDITPEGGLSWAGHGSHSEFDILGDRHQIQEPQGAVQALDGLLIESGGRILQSEVKAQLEASFSWRTIERAKKELGVKSVREGDAWVWTL